MLRLLVGLTSPSAGDAEVPGRRPVQSQDFLSSIGYLAQDVPLYGRLTAVDHLGIGAHLNRQWDERGAMDRLERPRVPMDRPVAKLSGGQRAQIGLGLALAKRPTGCPVNRSSVSCTTRHSVVPCGAWEMSGVDEASYFEAFSTSVSSP